MSDKLIDFFDGLCEAAQKIAKKEEVKPHLVIVKEGQAAIVPLLYSDETKEEVIMTTKTFLKEIKPEAVIMIGEARAWALKPKGKLMKWKDRHKYPYKDILIANLFIKDKTITRTWEVREKGIRRELSDYEENITEPDKQEGLMVFSDVLASKEDSEEDSLSYIA